MRPELKRRVPVLEVERADKRGFSYFMTIGAEEGAGQFKGDDNQEGGRQAQKAADVEIAELYFSFLPDLGKQDRGDQETAQNEEDINPHPSGRDKRTLDMMGHDDSDRDGS